ncbi:MAG: sigma-70 family RNA polymerase sigma factor [Dysgonamonadaceae bacterium]|jgi:RNA polymerase sigma factor (sigma-70 family)|nr:sigma-70 family RNA polymerase sigma factor [Dysgonamonadaceae bacterium]
MDDRLLWERFLEGDDKAYAVLYKKYVDALYSYGIKFTPDKGLVKDCIHDVFVKIYSHKKHLKPIENVKLYLYVALKNTLFNYFNEKRHFHDIDTVIEPVFNVDYLYDDFIFTEEEEQENSRNISRLLESLTPRQKEVIYYRYVEGMDLNMIRELMKMNYQSVLNLIQRSIKKIRTSYNTKDNKNKHQMYPFLN